MDPVWIYLEEKLYYCIYSTITNKLGTLTANTFYTIYKSNFYVKFVMILKYVEINKYQGRFYYEYNIDIY